jgi:NADPH2:quinone reductase
MKGLDVLGCPTIITTTRDPSVREPRLAQIMEWVESGRLVPMVGESFPLGQYADAMRAKWTSRFLGGCVLHP